MKSLLRSSILALVVVGTIAGIAAKPSAGFSLPGRPTNCPSVCVAQ